MLHNKFNDLANFTLALQYSAVNWGGHLHLESFMNALVFGLPAKSTSC